MAGDHHDGRADSLKRRPKPGNWKLRGTIQSVFSDFVEKRERPFTEAPIRLKHFLKRWIDRLVGLELAPPIEQRLPVFDWVGSATKNLMQSTFNDGDMPGNPHRMIASPRTGLHEWIGRHVFQRLHAMIAELKCHPNCIDCFHRSPSFVKLVKS